MHDTGNRSVCSNVDFKVSDTIELHCMMNVIYPYIAVRTSRQIYPMFQYIYIYSTSTSKVILMTPDAGWKLELHTEITASFISYHKVIKSVHEQSHADDVPTPGSCEISQVMH